MISSLPNVPLVESPFYERDSVHLSPEARAIGEQLRRDGLAVVDFPHDDFATLAAEIIDAVAPDYERQTETAAGRLQDAWRTHDCVRQVACNETVLGWLHELWGRRPVPFQTLNFPTGTEQAAHTDATHFASCPAGYMAGVWVALEDIGDDAGPLFYYPGSHRLPYFDNEHLGLLPDHDVAETYGIYPAYVELWRELAEHAGLQPVSLTMRRGQAVLWLSSVLHGGMPHTNREATRHSQVTHYFFDDCAYFTPLGSVPFLGEIELRNVTDICTGEPVPNRVNGVDVPLRVDRMRDVKSPPPSIRRRWAELTRETAGRARNRVQTALRRHDG